MGDWTKARNARTGRISIRARVAIVLLGCIAIPAQADHRIGAGGVVSLSNATTSLGCTDLVVAGTLNFQQGMYLAVRNVSILPGGVINGGTGSLTLSGTVSVDPAGQFNAQQLVLVQNVSACGAAVAAAPVVIPTLGNPLLFSLAALLLWLAHRRLRNENALRRG